MTDEEKRQMIALMLGDIAGSPYYPLFTDAQYGQFLAMGKGSVNSAVVFAAISASFIVSSEATREVIGDLSISKSTGTNYLKALDYLVKNAKSQIPANLMPWVGGLGERNKLLDFRLCDRKPLVCDTQPRARPPCPSPSNDLAVALKDTNLNVAENARGIEALDTRVTTTEAQIELLDIGVASTDADVGLLSSRVTDVEGKVTTLEHRVTDSEDKATTLEIRVTGTESGITALGGNITTLEANLSNVTSEVTATSSEMTAVKQRVLDTENVNVAQGVLIDAQGGYINTLKADTKYVDVDYLYGGDDGYSG